MVRDLSTRRAQPTCGQIVNGKQPLKMVQKVKLKKQSFKIFFKLKYYIKKQNKTRTETSAAGDTGPEFPRLIPSSNPLFLLLFLFIKV